jgi:hypothetical protein
MINDLIDLQSSPVTECPSLGKDRENSGKDQDQSDNDQYDAYNFMKQRRSYLIKVLPGLISVSSSATMCLKSTETHSYL